MCACKKRRVAAKLLIALLYLIFILSLSSCEFFGVYPDESSSSSTETEEAEERKEEETVERISDSAIESFYREKWIPSRDYVAATYHENNPSYKTTDELKEASIYNSTVTVNYIMQEGQFTQTIIASSSSESSDLTYIASGTKDNIYNATKTIKIGNTTTYSNISSFRYSYPDYYNICNYFRYPNERQSVFDFSSFYRTRTVEDLSSSSSSSLKVTRTADLKDNVYTGTMSYVVNSIIIYTIEYSATINGSTRTIATFKIDGAELTTEQRTKYRDEIENFIAMDAFLSLDFTDSRTDV